MGWSLGEVNDRAVGYGVLATCDHPGCEAEIDRGLSYACTGQHDHDTNDPDSCAGYFCEDHRYDHDHEAEPTGKDLGRDEYVPEAPRLPDPLDMHGACDGFGGEDAY